MALKYDDKDYIRLLKEKVESLKKLAIENPEAARKIAMKDLIRSGIIDEDGNLKPPYNGENVNEDDFSRGPKSVKKSKK